MAGTSPVWRGQASPFERSASATGIQAVGLLCVLSLTAVNCGGDSVSAPAAPTLPAPQPPPAEPPGPVLQARVSVYSVPSPYSGKYTEGMWIRLFAEFEEPVRVAGNPRLAIGIGEDTRYADATPDTGNRYSGPDHKAQRDTLLRFDYLIHADDLDPNGISIDADAFDFAEGTITGPDGFEINVEITSIVPSEAVPSELGANPRRRWLSAREPGLDIPEHPVAGRPLPRVCTDERQRALGRYPILVEEWDGTPFSFYFSLAGIPEHLRAEPDRMLEAAERLSEHIEDQIGYRLFEVGGLLEDSRIEPYDPDTWQCPWRERGQIVMMHYERTQTNHMCATFAGSLNYGTGSVAHSTFHLFGFDHSPNDWRGEHDYWKGNWMSLRLTGVYVDDEDIGVTYEDVDALRCIFPR